MKKTMGRLIFGAVLLAAVFLMSPFLFSAGVQAAEEVSEFDELKKLLEDHDAQEALEVIITEDLDISGQIEVSSSIKTLVINGSGKTLDGGETNSFLKVGSSIDLTLQNITIENCIGDDGAVIYADQPNTNITLTNSVFSNNIAEYGSGGVVYQEGGNNESTAESNTLTITGCTFTENGSGFMYGGAIYQ